MKRWLIYLGALLLAGAVSPFTGTDVAQLQPVEVLMITEDQGDVEITTDTGDLGRGKNLREAFVDLQQTSPKKIFMETAEYLLIDRSAESMLPEITEFLRPSCAVCFVEGEIELGMAAAFLNTHAPRLTLQNYRTGDRDLPRLVIKEERMYLVQ